jgi:hypothetical protein
MSKSADLGLLICLTALAAMLSLECVAFLYGVRLDGLTSRTRTARAQVGRDDRCAVRRGNEDGDAGIPQCQVVPHGPLRNETDVVTDCRWPHLALPDGAGGDNTIIQALTSITRLKQHRDESAALRAALEQVQGENLELPRPPARLDQNPQPSTAK